MKIQRAFAPITITLESPEEINMLRNLVINGASGSLLLQGFSNEFVRALVAAPAEPVEYDRASDGSY